MKNAFVLLKSRTAKTAGAVGSVFAAAAAHADTAAAIADAQQTGVTNVGLAVTAAIAVAALVLGFGIVLSVLKR